MEPAHVSTTPVRFSRSVPISSRRCCGRVNEIFRAEIRHYHSWSFEITFTVEDELSRIDPFFARLALPALKHLYIAFDGEAGQWAAQAFAAFQDRSPHPNIQRFVLNFRVINDNHIPALQYHEPEFRDSEMSRWWKNGPSLVVTSRCASGQRVGLRAPPGKAERCVENQDAGLQKTRTVHPPRALTNKSLQSI
ncbi:hypothetical protein B0H10DRAFT_1947266 [Mycena sp. CBHHK59/15]|nr:hypothetical protein B0H10DRAFT_1947266 [Mycena sp. CBHHK59/15]